MSLNNCENSELTTGLEGHVYRGPINPVEQEGQINTAPFSALFFVYNMNGNFIKSFSSNTAGEYKVLLVPGFYQIKPDKSAPIIGAENQIKSVFVESSGITSLDLDFDTGIR